MRLQFALRVRCLCDRAQLTRPNGVGQFMELRYRRAVRRFCTQ
jgi:hypothetical protein